jgi:hypothetical protein
VDDLTMWSLLVGAAAPTVIALVQRPTWPDWLRSVTTASFCLVAGAVTAYLNGDLTNGRSLVSAILLVLITTLSTYRGFWKPTGVAPAIESVTTPDQHPAPPPQHATSA